jgi:hypothetical protein
MAFWCFPFSPVNLLPVPQKSQFRLADIDLEKLRQIEAEVAPSHTEILKRELAKQWRLQLEKFPHPLQLVEEDGTVIKNRALVAQETAKEKLDEFLDHQHQLELRDTQIKVLTDKILELQRQALPEVAEQEQEEENASLTLAVWKATSVKPGFFGLSLDLKALTSDTIRIIRDRTRLIELDLNKRKRR